MNAHLIIGPMNLQVYLNEYRIFLLHSKLFPNQNPFGFPLSTNVELYYLKKTTISYGKNMSNFRKIIISLEFKFENKNETF